MGNAENVAGKAEMVLGPGQKSRVRFASKAEMSASWTRPGRRFSRAGSCRRSGALGGLPRRAVRPGALPAGDQVLGGWNVVDVVVGAPG